MKNKLVFSMISVAFVVIIITTILALKNKSPPYQGRIFCIMITGKDSERIQYATQSVKNFLSQSYSNKFLLIVNHHPTLSVLEEANIKNVNVYELRLVKTDETTLGDMRNIALQLVAHDACWTTWDDDDWRSPDYLEILSREMNPYMIVCISNRLEYNKNNQASWVGSKTDGFVLFLAPFDNRIKYLRKNTLEDIDILDQFKNAGYTLKVLNNDPRMYVRLVHTTNTSTYVRPNRDYLVRGPTYSERFTTAVEKMFINSILPQLVCKSAQNFQSNNVNK